MSTMSPPEIFFPYKVGLCSRSKHVTTTTKEEKIMRQIDAIVLCSASPDSTSQIERIPIRARSTVEDINTVAVIVLTLLNVATEAASTAALSTPS